MRLTICLAASLFILPTAHAEKTEKAADASQDTAASTPTVKLGGYIRARHGSVFEGTDGPDFLGLNDGFFLENARLVADIQQAKMKARISIDGAVDRRAASNTAVGTVDVGLKDAWVAYESTGYGLLVGQFKPPFDAEELQSTSKMLFIDRAVESRGVRGVEGYNMSGLSLDRQAGVQAYGHMDLSDSWAFGFAGSVTNGSGANHPQNDNDELAYTARLTIEQGEHLVLGGGFYFNRVTGGAAPDLLMDEEMGWVVDLAYQRQLGPVQLLLSGQYMERSTDSVDVPTEPTVKARGYHTALGLGLPGGYTVAYRFASLDPTADFEAEDPTAEAVLEIDAVTLHTAGVSYGCSNLPLTFQVNYTLAMEQAGRVVDNDRLDLLVQATF
jgi:hypothetical protein